MPNRLATETSPYLRQHADNPVEWYPWGEEALTRARQEDKPILLSIGYAACHWCHVMAHESFEDPATGAVMNDFFINIKVDREERPDLDSIYMQAVQAMTGHGGWPMTMFLTPDGVPFFGGTYFPPTDRNGMPAFTKVLRSVAEAYRDRRDSVLRNAEAIREIYRAAEQGVESRRDTSESVSQQTLERTMEAAYRELARQYDAQHGGFGGAPKFPPTMMLDFLLRYWVRTGTADALEMAHRTFLAMARGGIYDQVGGGFARYSVDNRWLVPHFEKMLYDNALLVRFGVYLYQVTGDAEVRRVTEETVDWLLREMTSPEGGWYSSLDADSEGVEGKFYLWSAAEIDALLRDDADIVKTYYGVTAAGNFEGENILHVSTLLDVVAARAGINMDVAHERIQRAKQVLYDTRAQRVWPGRDEKILAAWNGLALRAIAEAARVFGSAKYLTAAVRSAEFLTSALVNEGRVSRSYFQGKIGVSGFLEDYAALALGLIAVYEVTFDQRWLDQAVSLGTRMRELFWDRKLSVFFDTAADAEPLITRPRDISDNAIPSGNSLAVELLLQLAEFTGDRVLQETAEFVLHSLNESITRFPSAFGHLLGAIDMATYGAVEVALVGDPASEDFQSLVKEVSRSYIPRLILAGGTPNPASNLPLLENRTTASGKATAFVCRSNVCEAPVVDPQALQAQLRQAVRQ